MDAMKPAIPTVLCGVSGRHNFGDLLFLHVAASLPGQGNLLFVCFALHDVRCHAGRRLSVLRQLVDRPTNIIYIGGELLTCDALQAAIQGLHFLLCPYHRLAALRFIYVGKLYADRLEQISC